MTNVKTAKTRDDVIESLITARQSAVDALNAYRTATNEQTQIICNTPAIREAVRLLDGIFHDSCLNFEVCNPINRDFNANHVGLLIGSSSPSHGRISEGEWHKKSINLLEKHGIKFQADYHNIVIDPTQPEFFKKIAAAFGERSAEYGELSHFLSHKEEMGETARAEQARRNTQETTNQIWGNISEKVR